ncbi:MAG: alanine racemase [Tissierellia bacterium]|nr:alanine racemase [Tissierellia bacterium]
MQMTRPAWLEINLDKYKDNLKKIKENINPDTELLSIVKSDGYKFGAKEIVKAAKECGVSHFGVATLSEGISIRKENPDIEILILGYTPDYLMESAIEYDIHMACYSMDTAKALDQKAKDMGKKAGVHIVIDSGMNRIGFQPTEESIQTILAISQLENVEIYGMFTHFAVADADDDFTMGQFEKYSFVAKGLKEGGLDIPLHVSNSHATMRHREFDLTYVRPGILQYGSIEHDPAGEVFGVEFIGSIKAEIGHLKVVPEGQGISYGLTYTTTKPTKVATLPLGYADGIPRALSNKMSVLVNGVRCPQIGRICMDQFMIDVTGVDCQVGDEVVLIGKQGDEEITIEEISALVDEIPTSFVTHFNKRLPRVYIEDGKVAKVFDHFVEN